MGKIIVPIEPAILRYARKYSGYTLEEVAHKTKIAEERLHAYEDRKDGVPLHHLERLANVYKRPLAFFLLSNIPSDAVEPKDFRFVYASKESIFSPNAYLAIRRARYVQSVIAELGESQFDYGLPTVSVHDEPDDLAVLFREYINVSIKEQQEWVSPSVALREWKNALEAKEIFVLQYSMSKDSVSAFSLADKKPYVLVLDSSEYENRRIFSLFHEVGHLLLHKSGICTPHDLSRNSHAYVEIEKFCNQFSASLLLPKADFMSDIDVIRLSQTSYDSWTDDEIKKIAARFKVSQEVVLRRFQTFHYISEQAYENKRDEWSKSFDEFKKMKKKKPIIIPQYQKCLSQNGRGFTSMVLGQYHSNRISFSTAADILNINPKHIESLEMNLS